MVQSNDSTILHSSICLESWSFVCYQSIVILARPPMKELCSRNAGALGEQILACFHYILILGFHELCSFILGRSECRRIVSMKTGLFISMALSRHNCGLYLKSTYLVPREKSSQSLQDLYRRALLKGNVGHMYGKCFQGNQDRVCLFYL